jgi:hypothetical protein
MKTVSRPLPSKQRLHLPRSCFRLACRPANRQLSVEILSPKGRKRTHVPLGKSQLRLSSSLSLQSLLLLQASSNDSCGDREVLVVTVWGVLSVQLFAMAHLLNCSADWARRRIGTYVRPAAFHANAIVSGCWLRREVEFLWCFAGVALRSSVWISDLDGKN